MSYSEQEDLKYYLSGIYQDVAIAIVMILLYLTIGTGIYENTGAGSGQGVVEFDGSILLLIISTMTIGSVVFYLIFTRLKSIGIRVLYSIVLGLPYLLLLFEIFSEIVSQDQDLILYLLYFVLSLIIPIFAIIFIYIYGKGIANVTIRNLGILVSAGIIGRVMALYFDFIGIVVFAIVLSVFDIYSVFKGPLSKIMGEPQRIDNHDNGNLLPSKEIMDRQFSKICQEGTPVLLSYQNTLLGIGDVLFFSILMYHALIIWSWLGLTITLAMIIIGSSGTLFLLRKISPLPGLPLPVLFALIGYGILFQVVGIQ